MQEAPGGIHPWRDKTSGCCEEIVFGWCDERASGKGLVHLEMLT